MTLDPRWNEHFVIELNEWANISVHVFDWDRYFKNDFMGCAPIDLTSLSKSPSDVTLKLEDDDTEEDLGYLHLTLALRPIEGRNVDLTEVCHALHAKLNVLACTLDGVLANSCLSRTALSSKVSRRHCFHQGWFELSVQVLFLGSLEFWLLGVCFQAKIGYIVV